MSIYSDTGPFAIVPEWVLDADISDRAVRLYAVLARYADSDGHCNPKRATLASRLRCGVKTIDRAKEELAVIGALSWEQRPGDDRVLAPNDYLVRRVPPWSPMTRGGVTGDPRGRARADPGNESQLELDPATQGSTAASDRAPEPGTQQLVAAYIEDVRAVEAGHEPTRSWKLAAGRAIKRALDEGEDAAVVRTCLGIIAREGKNPSTLPHVVSDYHAKRPRRRT